ncbi:MAG TPA: thioredoxin family protein [Clostridiales bacterium]|nr:thioredoxin family protein [Clostridiales bacterium]
MAKKVTIFVLKYCGFCRTALRYLENVLEEHPEYRQLEIEQVDEAIERERARAHDYFYVPTFYIGQRKVHEGAVRDQHQIEAILQEAAQSE